jgi:hypothetical protein
LDLRSPQHFSSLEWDGVSLYPMSHGATSEKAKVLHQSKSCLKSEVTYGVS